MQKKQPTPDLSVILVATHQFESIRRSVRHLHAQNARGRLELVIVAPSDEALRDCRVEEVDGFVDVKRVSVGAIENVDEAAAVGALQASAPVVVLLEDHAYPAPGWAEALIEAHEGPWGVVGSAMLNANPDSMISWTNQLIAYGCWTEPAKGGEIDALPGHNASYKRALLAAYGEERLKKKLGREGGLIQELRAGGHRIYLEPRARLSHANPSSLLSTMALRFNAGRLYGAKRAQANRWSWLHKLLYITGSPLIPVVRFRRLRGELFGEGQHPDLMPLVLPALFFGLVLDAIGQMVGYAIGTGATVDRLARFEMDRMRHLNPSDRRLLTE